MFKGELEICEEISYPLFHKKADVSVFVEYLEKMRCYPSFSVVDSKSPYKDHLFSWWS